MGGRLMSDMKTVLHADSVKCSKKGQEEIQASHKALPTVQCRGCMTPSHVTYYFSCVSVCCLALHVYIAHDVCSCIPYGSFPSSLRVRLVVLVQHSRRSSSRPSLSGWVQHASAAGTIECSRSNAVHPVFTWTSLTNFFLTSFVSI